MKKRWGKLKRNSYKCSGYFLLVQPEKNKRGTGNGETVLMREKVGETKKRVKNSEMDEGWATST